MALTLTFPERVTEHNIEKLKQRVLNGERGGLHCLYGAADKDQASTESGG